MATATAEKPKTGNKKSSKPDEGEQLDLIEVEPEEAKEIARIARAYKKAQKARVTALAEEIKQKEKLLAVVKEAKLQPGVDGMYTFKANGTIITVTPRDELVKVKFEDEDAED